MKKTLTFITLSLLFHFLIAQTAPHQYWIHLKDKNNSIYSINKPNEYLSQRAIDRREKQHIPINISDLPVNTAYINEIRSMGLEIIYPSKWFNTIAVSTNDTVIIESLIKLNYVNKVIKIEKSKIDTSHSKFCIHLNNDDKIQAIESPPLSSDLINYGFSFKQANQIGAVCMHNLGYQGQGISIAVLDAGFLDVNVLPAFDSLRINNLILGTRDFVTGDTMVYEDFPHGMNVLSCMAANLPGNIVGTAPKAKYWLLRTEDAGSEGIIEEINWLRAAEFADSVGVDIINSSLGYRNFDNSADNHGYADLDGNTTIITKAADMVVSKGVFVVSSAGNSGGPPWFKIVAPADADSILTVGAVDSVGNIATFSSRGLTFDGRIKPNTVARGVQVVLAALGGGVVSSSGTSFSCPVTAGAVACLWQANPSASAMQLLNAIQQSASMFTSPDSISGYGIPNFCLANTILTNIEHRKMHVTELIVYPNPFNNNLDIRFFSDKQQTINITLYDISGREIVSQEKKINTVGYTTINFLKTFMSSKGTYLLRLRTEDKTYFEKLINNN